MNPFLDYSLLLGSALVIAAIAAGKLGQRLGVPALLLFLALGMLAGSDGPGGIYFDDDDLAQSAGVVALVVIIFSGGLESDWGRLRRVLAPGAALASLGVVITAGLMGVFTAWYLNLPLVWGLLLGAIVSSTDAAAVFSVLRGSGAEVKGDLAPLLELESGSNDPLAVFLTLGLIQLQADPNASWLSLGLFLVRQLAIGGAVGWLAGEVLGRVINRARLPYPGLYPVLTLAMCFLSYGGAAVLGGSGFLAVYLAGLGLSRREFLHKPDITRFFGGLAWLMQIAMFLVLGLLVFPKQLVEWFDEGLVLAAFLVFLARPAAVFTCLALSRLNWRERLFTAWVGLRGAAPIVLATFPYQADLPESRHLFNLVFFIVLVSVLAQGSTLPWVARRLGLAAPARSEPALPLDYDAVLAGTGRLMRVEVLPGWAAAERRVMDLGLPPGALIILLHRAGHWVLPNGGTVLAGGDHLVVLADAKSWDQARRALEEGPEPLDSTLLN